MCLATRTQIIVSRHFLLQAPKCLLSPWHTGQHCQPTLSAYSVGSCVAAADKCKIFDEKALQCNPFPFDGRQCWPVCRGSRQCRPTNPTFNCYFLVVFCRFSQESCGILSWNFPDLSLGVLSTWVQRDWFFLCDIPQKYVSINIYHCVNDSSKSRFFAEILQFFFSFILNKIRRND